MNPTTVLYHIFIHHIMVTLVKPLFVEHHNNDDEDENSEHCNSDGDRLCQT